MSPPALMVMLVACGLFVDEQDDASSSSTDTADSGLYEPYPVAAFGQVGSDWDERYCSAVFTRNFKVYTLFRDYVFSIAEGDVFLLGKVADDVSAGQLLLMTPYGSIDMDLYADADNLPYTTDCSDADESTDIVTFSEVVVYADAELTKRSCSLPAQSVIAGSLTMYVVSSNEADGDVYYFQLPGMASLCDGAVEGFAHTQPVLIGPTSFGVLPFTKLLRLPATGEE